MRLRAISFPEVAILLVSDGDRFFQRMTKGTPGDEVGLRVARGMSTFGMSEAGERLFSRGRVQELTLLFKRKINRRKSTYAKRDSTKRYIHRVRR